MPTSSASTTSFNGLRLHFTGEGLTYSPTAVTGGVITAINFMSPPDSFGFYTLVATATNFPNPGIQATTLGGAGSDRFDYNAAGEGGDIISDFATGIGNDKLDLKDVLVGYDSSTSALADFVQPTVSGGNTVVSVDPDGAGSGHSSTHLVTLQNLTGLLLSDMQANGNLIAG